MKPFPDYRLVLPLQPYSNSQQIWLSSHPNSVESTPESHSLFSLKSKSVHVRFIHHLCTSCPKRNKSAFLFNPLSQLYHQGSATYPRAKLSFRRLRFEQHIPAPIHSAAGLQSSTPSRNKRHIAVKNIKY